eukprot:TRINITY_DN61218_c0_g1_i1.p1 TRINITY_DN61218_c0_g1~~TRINITY_DN61218_c0_g1_i1.p1  ORF type:complete len:297 (+),score=45.85 TRINITY_DN61218_c0_g1_i1:47-937(+)
MPAGLPDVSHADVGLTSPNVPRLFTLGCSSTPPHLLPPNVLFLRHRAPTQFLDDSAPGVDRGLRVDRTISGSVGVNIDRLAGSGTKRAIGAFPLIATPAFAISVPESPCSASSFLCRTSSGSGCSAAAATVTTSIAVTDTTRRRQILSANYRADEDADWFSCPLPLATAKARRSPQAVAAFLGNAAGAEGGVKLPPPMPDAPVPKICYHYPGEDPNLKVFRPPVPDEAVHKAKPSMQMQKNSKKMALFVVYGFVMGSMAAVLRRLSHDRCGEPDYGPKTDEHDEGGQEEDSGVNVF